jgi:prepilin-type N-terminal cleavage/methylation domain-containing protein/prepilin-type processing-associated H-X9-DG protein
MRYTGTSRAWNAQSRSGGTPARSVRPLTTRKLFSSRHLPIILHQSSFINRKGFTLIELLVVISIIALLLVILFPALRAGRSHARTAKCQGTLHQWGLYYARYTAENDYKMPTYLQETRYLPDVLPRSFYKHHYVPKNSSPWDRDGWRWDLQGYRRLLFCPEASVLPANPEVFAVTLLGRTHSAWVENYPDDRTSAAMSSYGLNGWTPGPPGSIPYLMGKPVWVSCLAKGAAAVPVYSDCMLWLACPQETDSPPPKEDAPPEFCWSYGMPTCVMDRHRGGINSLFMDWSVRKVGLKELWTLKWSKDFDTAGPWTKAGGVQPEDWPQWMRRFKDN